MNAYGKNRRFGGLEAFAIRARLKIAENLLHRVISANNSVSVIELGCGYYAANLRYLATRFPTVSFVGVDVDVDEQAVNNVSLHRAELTLWRPSRTFDCVLSLAVVEHLVDPLRHFHLISSCLSEKGIAVMTTPTPAADMVLRLLAATHVFDREAICDHKIYLTDNGIRTLARISGLELLSQRTTSLGMQHVCELARTQER